MKGVHQNYEIAQYIVFLLKEEQRASWQVFLNQEVGLLTCECMPASSLCYEHFPFSLLLKAALGIMTLVLWEVPQLS